MRSLVCAFLVAVTLISPSHADERWPQRTVNLVVPFGAGGTIDIFGRLIAQHMQATFGQPFVVENRVGGGGSVGTAAAARAAADGYTLLVGSISTMGIGPVVYSKLPYDAARDFVPVAMIGTIPNLLVVHPRIPATTVAELIAHLKANPNKLSYGSSGVGTSIHLSAELFKMMTGTTMTHVPFRSANDSMNSLAGGHIDLAFDNIPLALPLAKAGNVRAIAVTSAQRSPSAPDVPPVADTLPGFDVNGWVGLFVPAGTPRPIVDKLAAEVARIVALPEVRQKLFDIGSVPGTLVGERFATFAAAERAKWAEVAKTAGIKLD